MANSALAGIATIAVDGKTYLLAGDLSYSPTTVERETLTGQDQVHGFKEMPKAGFISGTFRDTGGLTVQDFNAMRDVNVTVALINGKTIVGRNMWCVTAPEVKATDGTFEIKFEGQSVTEVL